MSNGDHEQKHMVCMKVPHPTQPDKYFITAICATPSGQPAVYHDAGHAELHAANLRTENPAGTYMVVSFQVL